MSRYLSYQSKGCIRNIPNEYDNIYDAYEKYGDSVVTELITKYDLPNTDFDYIKSLLLDNINYFKFAHYLEFRKTYRG